MSNYTGRKLGKYELIEQLGRGGMADVYKAYQPGMDRYVAVKLLHGHLASSEDFVTRFQREAQNVGQLRHPHIVQVIDFDVADDVYYMVMEYIRGDTLKTYIQQQGALSPLEAFSITEKLSDALAYAHEHGMIHRDIKPANVMFTEKTYKHPVLTDFGIAKILGDAGLTATGAFIGTPAYMSPEVGRGDPADERSDIYSLGVMLYEMVAGKVPYDADTPFAIVMKHVNSPVPSPRQLNANLPDTVEKVILKALTKDPADRFQTAADLRNTLRNAQEEISHTATTAVGTRNEATVAGQRQAGEAETVTDVDEEATYIADLPTRTGQPSANEAAPAETKVIQSAKRKGLSPLLIAAAAILALAILLGGALATGVFEGDDSGDGESSVAQQDETQTEEGIEDNATSSAEPQDRVTPTTTQAVEDDATEIADAGEAQTNTGGSETGNEEADAKPVVENVGQRYTAFFEEEEGDIVRRANLLQSALRNQGFERAIEIVNEGLAEHPESPFLLGLRSELYLGDGRFEAAFEDANAAIEINPEHPMGYIARAEYQFNNPEYDYDAALADARTAYELMPEHPETALAYALALQRNNQTEQAIELYEEAEANGAYLPILLDRRGFMFWENWNFERVIEDYSRLLQINPGSFEHRLRLAASHALLENTDRALNILQDGFEYIDGAAYYANAAFVASMVGEVELAQEWAETALALDGEQGPAHYALAMAAAENGDYEAALERVDLIDERDLDYQWPVISFQVDRYLPLDTARLHYAMGNTGEALRRYETLITNDLYWYYVPYIERAEIFLAEGETEAALFDLLNAYERTDDNEETRQEVRRRIAALGKDTLTDAVHSTFANYELEVALSLANIALDAYPESAALYGLRSQIYTEMGEYEAAQADAETASGVVPPHPAGYIAYAKFYESQNDYAQMLDYAQRGFEAFPEDSQIALTYARALRTQDEPAADPADIYQVALNNDADLAMVLRERADYAYYDINDYALAIKDLEAYLAREPDDPYAVMMLASSYILTERGDETLELALSHIDRVNDVDVPWEQAYLYTLFAYVAYHNEEPELAEEWLSLARQADDSLPQIQYTEGLVARQLGDYERALEIFAHLETLDSWVYSSEFLDQRFEHFLPLDIARTYMQQDDYDAAIERYTSIIETTGGWPRIYVERADAFLALGETEAARADFIAARELADDPDIKDAIMERIRELGEAASEDNP